ncbi:DUF5941 domain-containing protein [Nocardiopsis changdeensis]|uniref:DUF5941 domain-containing protein n=1 Tax=Nocardiopsis changdeensis TaxID=2831969 RepID=A0ABX8BSC8_9ACTN|nr:MULTISPECIES: DUF5941 domain-containing protein [Nocardiopsis]QUX23736.1 hypothetical protein KGD84_05160 [Nocardiopsis changdeensis]QYX39681.1 hypothetical protein K1J57_14615 [Nocardiopsis sp. MT53]
MNGAQGAARTAGTVPDLRALRDDGHFCRLAGRVAPGLVPPLPTAAAAAMVVLVLLAADRGLPAGITLFAPVAALLLSGTASGHPHDGRFDRLVPPVLRVMEYAYLMVVGLASGVPGPLVFVLLMTVACHHRDDAVRPPVGVARSPRTRAAALGWDGRMLVVAAGSALHVPVPVYGILAGYLAVLLVTEAVRTWSATPVADVLPAGTVPEDGAGPGHPRPGYGQEGDPAPVAETFGEA